jgi:DNA adenine methylase
MTAPRRPALRWHGGKWMLAPWIVQHFGPHQVYVEPFGGAASVLLRKPRSYAEIYNDLDNDAVNLFRILRDKASAHELVRLLRLTPFARCEFLAAYDRSEDPVERARQLVIRSFMGFGSNGHARATGFRSCSNRSGSTPAHDWLNLPDNLLSVSERLAGVIIENRDARDVMFQHDGRKTLHFIDPPYLPETRTDSRPDYAIELTDDDHRDLLTKIQELSGAVVLCGYPSQTYDGTLAGWQRITRAALADGAKPRTECLWLNSAAQHAIAQKSLFS